MSGSSTGAFEIIQPPGRRQPIIGHVPHASTFIPDDIRREILLDDRALSDELLRITDRHTDALFTWLARYGATLFVNRLSRLVFDPERLLVIEAEPTEAVGQGVVYTHGTRRQRLRYLRDEARTARIEKFYRPYHAALDAITGEIVDGSGACMLIDCHSFPSRPLPSELDQTPDRPDFCIGTDAFHTPPHLADALERSFGAHGFSVGRDSPFSGTLVPGASFRRDTRVRAVMIEVRRGLYMDEETGVRLPEFEAISGTIERALLAAGVLDR